LSYPEDSIGDDDHDGFTNPPGDELMVKSKTTFIPSSYSPSMINVFGDVRINPLFHCLKKVKYPVASCVIPAIVHVKYSFSKGNEVSLNLRRNTSVDGIVGWRWMMILVLSRAPVAGIAVIGATGAFTGMGLAGYEP
jgi:hypothetical protein